MGRPGSLLWLAASDMRLGVRAAASAAGGALSVRTAILVAGAFAALLLMVRPVGRWIAAAAADPTRAAALDGAMTLGAAIVLPWIASHALTGATRSLYGRGDLDLLLTSPLPPQRILAARALAIFVEATTAVSVFLLPVLISAVWFGGLRWLALAPTIIGLGLLGAAGGVALALGLFRLVGPQRTRQIAQVVAMLLGVTFVAVLQALNFLPQEFDARLGEIGAPVGGDGSAIGHALLVPARAAQGDLFAMTALIGAGAGALALVCAWLGRSFVQAALSAAGAPARSGACNR